MAGKFWWLAIYSMKFCVKKYNITGIPEMEIFQTRNILFIEESCVRANTRQLQLEFEFYFQLAIRKISSLEIHIFFIKL